MQITNMLPRVMQAGKFARHEADAVAECLAAIVQAAEQAGPQQLADEDELADWLAEQLTADLDDDRALLMTRVCYAAADVLYE